MNKLFAQNVGMLDRAIRLALGILLVALVFTGPHTPWGWIGLIPLLTGIAGTCPVYGMLGISTNHHTHGGAAA